MHDALVKMIVPGVPMLYPVVWGITYLPVTQHLRLLQLERQLQILKRAGVPILLGTDSANWPMFPWVFHGPTAVHELERMVDAGLRRWTRSSPPPPRPRECWAWSRSSARSRSVSTPT